MRVIRLTNTVYRANRITEARIKGGSVVRDDGVLFLCRIEASLQEISFTRNVTAWRG
jgi:hypothetical protein